MAPVTGAVVAVYMYAMKHSIHAAVLVLVAILPACQSAPKERVHSTAESLRIAGLDAYWTEVSRAVREGDFAAYEATVHPEGVLVNGIRKTTMPLAKALAKWKTEFDDTKAGRIEADVVFRFSERLGDDTTAHETGIFLYTQTKADGEKIAEYIEFEALLTKREGRWVILMEYQKSKTTRSAWDALPST